MTRNKRRIRALEVLGILSLVSLLVTACAGTLGSDAVDSAEQGVTSEQDPSRIRVAIAASVFGPAQAPYTSLPQDLGYWQADGLEVELLGFAGSGLAVQAVVAGEADIGLASPSLLYPAIAKGSPLIGFFNQITKNAYMPVVEESSPVSALADFEGKTIGVTNLEAQGVILVESAMAIEGLDSSTVDFVAVGGGAEALTFLRNGDVDILALFDTPYAEIEAQGVNLREVGPEWLRELSLHQVIFGNKEFIEQNAAAVEAYSRGVAKASLFAAERPEEAITRHWETYPDNKPTGLSDSDAMEQAVRTLEKRNANTIPVEDKWGYATEEQVQESIRFLVEGGILESGLNPDAVFTSKFIDAANDFDADEVR